MTKTVPASSVDRTTMHYLELVSGRLGQQAVDAWLLYIGWRDETETPPPRNNRSRATKELGNGTGRPAGRPRVYINMNYSARRQISIEDRMRIAFNNARVAP